MILMTGSQNEPADSKAMEYWSEVRVKHLSTNSEWLTEVCDDVIALVDLTKIKGISDKNRLSYTRRAIEALAEVEQFLKPKENDIHD